MHSFSAILFSFKGVPMTSLTYTKNSVKEFASSITYKLASRETNNRLLCVSICNHLSQCNVVSYNRETRMCNIYASLGNHSIDLMSTDIFVKNTNIVPSTYENVCSVKCET